MKLQRLGLLLALLASACGGDATPGEGADWQDLVADDGAKIVDDCTGLDYCVPVCVNTGPDDVCADLTPPTTGGCWVTGGGFVDDEDGKDTFGGNGMSMKNGRIRGQWQHVDHGTGNKMHGQVEYLMCRRVETEPGPGHPNGPRHDFNLNQAYYGGPARWFTPGTGWAEGYWFDLRTEDHGEPGNRRAGGQSARDPVPDEYWLTVREMVADMQSGAVIYEVGGEFIGGNFQIHPPNNGHPYQAGELPPWVTVQD